MSVTSTPYMDNCDLHLTISLHFSKEVIGEEPNGQSSFSCFVTEPCRKLSLHISFAVIAMIRPLGGVCEPVWPSGKALGW